MALAVGLGVTPPCGTAIWRVESLLVEYSLSHYLTLAVAVDTPKVYADEKDA